MSFIRDWAIRFVMTRVLQPSSAVGYANAVWTWTNWVPNAQGVTLVQQFISVALSLVLFLVNEKPWGKKSVD